MHTTLEFLDAVKAAHNIPSDYALAQQLEVTRSAVSAYRTKGALLDTKVALRVADLLGIDRPYVVACVEWERAQRAGNEQEEAMWEIVAAKFKAAARKLTSVAKAALWLATVALLSLFFGGGPNGGAMAAELSQPSSTVQVADRLCIMSNALSAAATAIRRIIAWAQSRLWAPSSPVFA